MAAGASGQCLEGGRKRVGPIHPLSGSRQRTTVGLGLGLGLGLPGLGLGLGLPHHAGQRDHAQIGQLLRLIQGDTGR